MLRQMIGRIGRSTQGERGATAIEYVLIGAVMATVVVAGVAVLGTGLSTTFTTIATLVTGATAP